MQTPGTTQELKQTSENFSIFHTFLPVNYIKHIFADVIDRRPLGIKMAKMHVCNINQV